MCSHCKLNRQEIELLEAEAIKKISVACVILVDEANKAMATAGPPAALELEAFAKRFAMELIDQVEYDTVPGSPHHLAVACSLADLGSAWLRANANL